MSLGDGGTHGYFPKDRDGTGPETRTSSKFRTQKPSSSVDTQTPERSNVCKATKHAFVSFPSTSQSKPLINMVSFHIVETK